MKTDFFFKRIHSLTGLGLALFLLVHLGTNAQVAWTLWWGSDWFVNSVNNLNTLPFLRIVEVGLLALPFLVHGYLGWQQIVRARYLVLQGEGEVPSLGDIPSNRLYTWQRWTGLVLLVLVVWHVWEMRFWKRPLPLQIDEEAIIAPYLIQMAGGGERVVSSFGEGVFLVLRETFGSLWMSLLYSFFVLVASYHAARGVFTAGITWGVLVHAHRRDAGWFYAKWFFVLLMVLGSLAIWSCYFWGEPM